ncbi:glycosyltransferase family 4 protein [Sphingomonas sp. BK235]|uniref:glycosyltransferase family 4 protein n=1 Tax=Sphingomonas sp. BK235 TaxID=2512131 RepID=UPI0010D44253|nr:glycosyltransferase family 4 protein [Sphingomonas sp. BK235]TCP29364.1 glycosyltransferase involved in cell wall biosynthesis [Sphingomonas sp. BK235]
MTNVRLWVVSELFYPETTSTGYFLTGIAEGLAVDHDVHALCSRPTYSERGQRVPWREQHKGVTIQRVRSSTFAKDWLLGRVLNMITFSLLVTLTLLHKSRRGDALLVVTNPPLATLLLGIVARWKGLRSILLVHDVYPEVLHATGHLRPAGPASRLIETVMRWVFRRYDDVVVLGRDMAELIARKIGTDRPIVIIPNWGDPEEVTPLARGDNPFAIAHGLVDHTVIQFSGNLGRTHDIETVLAAARRLSDRASLRFLFVGYGGKTDIIADASACLPNVLFAPRQPREMLGAMLSCADATLIAFSDKMLGVSVPSRMYNVMAAGAPLVALADPRSELAQVITEETCGWTLTTGDIDGLCDLLTLIDSPAGRLEARRRGENGRNAVLHHYTRETVVAGFAALLGDTRRATSAPRRT